MDHNESGFAAEVRGVRTEESQGPELHETLQKVDRGIEDFYKIFGDLLEDQGENP